MRLSLLDRLQLLRGFISIARDPRNLDGVLDLADHIADREGAMELLPPHLEPVVRGFERPEVLPPLSALRALPAGSLGREYARFMDANGLTPAALDRDTGDSQLQRFRAQMRMTHDLWHVATGWTPDLLGELGLQAFYLAQLRIPFPAFALAAGLLHTIWKAPRHFYDIVDAVAEGYRQGKEAQLLAAVRWAPWLAQPVEEVRFALGLRGAAERSEPVIPLVA